MCWPKKIDNMNKELALNAKSRLSVVVASTAHLTRVPPIGRRRLPSDVSSPRSPSLSVWWSLFARSFLLSQTAAAVDYLFVHINTSRHRRERTTHRSSMMVPSFEVILQSNKGVAGCGGPQLIRVLTRAQQPCPR